MPVLSDLRRLAIRRKRVEDVNSNFASSAEIFWGNFHGIFTCNLNVSTWQQVANERLQMDQSAEMSFRRNLKASNERRTVPAGNGCAGWPEETHLAICSRVKRLQMKSERMCTRPSR